MNGEKPYDFVSLPKRGPDRKKGIGQDQLRANLYSGVLQLTLHTLTPVHVGMGYSDFVKAGNQEHLAALQASKPVREGNTVRRQYLIPGSSIKGAVRSIVEAITRSCVRVTKSEHHHLPKAYHGCTHVDALCTACRLFGARDYQGHLRFEDAIAPKGTLVLLRVPLLWEPARGKRGLPSRYLSRDGMAKGRKFYFHARYATSDDPRTCIKSGAELPLSSHFQNLSKADLGVLLTALGVHPEHPFPIKLGGGKPVGLGSVEVIPQSITLLQGADSLRTTGRLAQTRTIEGSELESLVSEYTRAADTLIDSNALGELESILDTVGLEETAPADPY
ncbi:MAG: RAMP superfamily CRISPR-associated protein [Fimbriimonadales bacterium]